MSLWSNLKLRGFKDLLSVKKWFIFATAKVREKQGTKVEIGGGESLTITNEELQSYAEQIIYRQSFSECKSCLKIGECTHCGCKTPDLFFDKEMVCSGGNWNEMLGPVEWEQYKIDNRIEIGVIRNRK